MRLRLGDPAPAMFPKTTWFTPDLTLVACPYGTAILFAMGTGSVREALDSVEGPLHLQVQRDMLEEIARHSHPSAESPDFFYPSLGSVRHCEFNEAKRGVV